MLLTGFSPKLLSSISFLNRLQMGQGTLGTGPQLEQGALSQVTQRTPK